MTQGWSLKLPAIKKSSKINVECQSPFVNWFSILVGIVFFRFLGQIFFVIFDFFRKGPESSRDAR